MSLRQSPVSILCIVSALYVTLSSAWLFCEIDDHNRLNFGVCMQNFLGDTYKKLRALGDAMAKSQNLTTREFLDRTCKSSPAMFKNMKKHYLNFLPPDQKEYGGLVFDACMNSSIAFTCTGKMAELRYEDHQ